MKNYSDSMENSLTNYRAVERQVDSLWTDKLKLHIYSNYTKHFYDRARTLTKTTETACGKIHKSMQYVEELMKGL